jgi:hypothetical protein
VQKKAAPKLNAKKLANAANRKYKGSVKNLIQATNDKQLKLQILKALLTNPLLGKAHNFDDFLADYQYILKRGNMQI